MPRAALIVLVLTIAALGAAGHAEASVPNGYLLNQTLNARQLPDALKTTKSGSPNAVWLSYLYDARRKISSVADLDGTGANEGRSYAYDANGRLLTTSGPWGQQGTQATGSFKYDALGNLREQVLGTRTIAVNYAAATNRVSSAVDNGVTKTSGLDPGSSPGRRRASRSRRRPRRLLRVKARRASALTPSPMTIRTSQSPFRCRARRTPPTAMTAI